MQKKHFDCLVELLNKGHIKKDEGVKGLPNVYDYLHNLVKDAQIYLYPKTVSEIPGLVGKNHEEYMEWITKYFKLSQENGQFLITPSPLTVIEDLESVIFLDKTTHEEDNKFRVTVAKHHQDGNNNDKVWVDIGDVTIVDPVVDNKSCSMKVTPLYTAVCENKKRVRTLQKDCLIIDPNDIKFEDGAIVLLASLITEGEIKKDQRTYLMHETMKYLQELIFINDPERSWVTRVETKVCQSHQYQVESGKLKKEKLLKTIVRPHYKVYTPSGLENLFKKHIPGSKKKPHLRSGSWRTFTHERYKAMRGKTKWVGQYYTGKGKFVTDDGSVIRVMVKKKPTEMVYAGNGN